MTRDRWTVKILKKMRIRRQLSLRGLRPSHSSGFKESDEEIFRTVDRDYRRELRISRSKYGKVAEYINEIYRALANYDVRFEFDPMSVDDHRCEVVSASELKLTCELKHISKRTCEVDGDSSNGRIQIRLRDDVRSHRYSTVAWDDVCSKGKGITQPNYLNTRNLLDVFTTALGRAVRDVWNKHRNVGLVYRVSGNQARIYLDIPDTGFFTVTLIPAIKLTKSTIDGMDSELLKGLGEKGDVFSTIYAIAQPNRFFQDESWQLSYKTLENRIMNDEQFTCGRVCLHALRHLLLSPKSPRCGIKALTLSDLQLAVIQEHAKHPHANDWTPATFIKRLTGTMTSLTLCLREGICVNQFSGVNVFSQFDLKSLRVLAKDVEHANAKCRGKLLKR